MNDIPLLYNNDVEMALIGIAISYPEILISNPIQAEDFYLQKCQTVWRTLLEMQRQNRAIDYLTITENLNASDKLMEIGGLPFITECVSLGLYHNAPEYSRIIHDYYLRRKALRSANELARVAYDLEVPITENISKITVELASTGLQSTHTKSFSEFTASVVEQAVEASKNPNSIWGIPTGFSELDEWLGGWQLGEVFHLAGEPGIGKSRMALQFALNASSLKCGSNPSVIYSLEMKGIAMAMRGISALSQVPTRNFRTGEIEPDQWTRIYDNLEKSTRMPLWINDNSAMTIHDIRADLASMIAKHNVKLAVIDYLYLVRGMESKDDNERIAKISAEIKRIARDLNVFIISVDSVVKSGMDVDSGQVRKSMIRGSGQLSHDADLIAFVKRNDIDDQNLITLEFVKTRDVAGTQYKFELRQYATFPLIEEKNIKHTM